MLVVVVVVDVDVLVSAVDTRGGLELSTPTPVAVIVVVSSSCGCCCFCCCGCCNSAASGSRGGAMMMMICCDDDYTFGGYTHCKIAVRCLLVCFARVQKTKNDEKEEIIRVLGANKLSLVASFVCSFVR